MQLFSLTEKEEDMVSSHHAKTAHDPVSIKEENVSVNYDNDVPVSKKSVASKSPAVPVASVISRAVPHVTYVLVGAGTASFAAMKVRRFVASIYFLFIEQISYFLFSCTIIGYQRERARC